MKKVFLEISQNSQENTCARVFLGTGFFIFTSHFVTKKYFIMKDNQFHLDRSLIRPLGYIKDVVFLQGSFLRYSQNLLKKITLQALNWEFFRAGEFSWN